MDHEFPGSGPGSGPDSGPGSRPGLVPRFGSGPGLVPRFGLEGRGSSSRARNPNCEFPPSKFSACAGFVWCVVYAVWCMRCVWCVCGVPQKPFSDCGLVREVSFLKVLRGR